MNRWYSGVAVAALFTAGAPAIAQQAVDSDRVEDIQVTAEKRSENLKDVPISISAIGSTELELQKIRDYDDLSRAVPGVSFNSVGANEGLTNVIIRGVSSTSGSATVGIYLDDVSMTVKNFYDGSAQPKIFDIDRIEVLRGPQGTIWGASSMGGTIRFVTPPPKFSDPSIEVGSELSGTEHGGINYNETVVVNAPLVENRIALRASFGYFEDSGYIDRYNQSFQLLKNGVNEENAFVGRLAALIDVTDRLTITPALFFQRDNTADNSAFYPALGLWNQDKQVIEYGRDTLLLPSLTANYDLGFADLTSVSGYFKRLFNREQDGTFYNSTIFATAFLDPIYPQYQPQNDAIIGNLASPVHYRTFYSQYSEELRLASHPPGPDDWPLRWVVGLYYADQFIHNTDYQRIPGINTAFQQIYGIPMEQSLVNTYYGAPNVPLLFPNDVDEADNRHYDERQYAVFGQLDYDFLPRLHGSLGWRYLDARVAYNSTEYGFYQIGNISPYIQLSHFSATTPKYTLSYDVTDQTNVYASAAKGFRLGGPTGPTPFGPTSVCAGDFAAINVTSQPVKFNSDRLWTYELGSKNEFLSDKVTINAAGYYTQWDDIQQQIYLPTCGYYFTQNIGDAEIYGGEFEARVRPLKGLTLSLNASYEHATVTRSANPATVAVGERLIDVPVYTYDSAAEYSWPLSGEMTAVARADWSYTGHSYGSYQVANSNFFNPAYGTLNLSVGVTTPGYDVMLFAKNALDDRTIIQRPEINTVIEGYTLRPLTVGISAHLRVGG